jgi:hypothetical protein
MDDLVVMPTLTHVDNLTLNVVTRRNDLLGSKQLQATNNSGLSPFVTSLQQFVWGTQIYISKPRETK